MKKTTFCQKGHNQVLPKGGDMYFEEWVWVEGNFLECLQMRKKICFPIQKSTSNFPKKINKTEWC